MGKHQEQNTTCMRGNASRKLESDEHGDDEEQGRVVRRTQITE